MARGVVGRTGVCAPEAAVGSVRTLVVVRLEKALGAVLELQWRGVVRLAADRWGWCLEVVQLDARAEQIWGVLPEVGGERSALGEAAVSRTVTLLRDWPCAAVWPTLWGVRTSEAGTTVPLGVVGQPGDVGSQPGGVGVQLGGSVGRSARGESCVRQDFKRCVTGAV
jgi:hypothetical protein